MRRLSKSTSGCGNSSSLRDEDEKGYPIGWPFFYGDSLPLRSPLQLHKNIVITEVWKKMRPCQVSLHTMFSGGLEDAHVRVFEFASAVDGAVVVLIAVAKGA